VSRLTDLARMRPEGRIAAFITAAQAAGIRLQPEQMAAVRSWSRDIQATRAVDLERAQPGQLPAWTAGWAGLPEGRPG